MSTRPSSTSFVLSRPFILSKLILLFFCLLSSLLFGKVSFADDQLSEHQLLENYLNLKKQSLQNKATPTKPSPKSRKGHAKTPALLAIIIDDIGNSSLRGKEAVLLPGKITYAVLPHTPNGISLAKLAYNNNKEVMLHAPMESLLDTRLGDGGLTKEMHKDEFIKILRSDIDSVPYLKGINNHMGSLLTQNKIAMTWLMEEIAQKKLYFVDSRTTSASVANNLANEYAVRHISRDVFLDNEQNEVYIDKAFKKAVKIAKKTGSGVAIGHPYPATISYLKKALVNLDENNIKLVLVSELIKYHNDLATNE